MDRNVSRSRRRRRIAVRLRGGLGRLEARLHPPSALKRKDPVARRWAPGR